MSSTVSVSLVAASIANPATSADILDITDYVTAAIDELLLKVQLNSQAIEGLNEVRATMVTIAALIN